MSDKKNNVAFVLVKLRNNSKSSGAPFQQVLQQYAIERFLYRVSKSKHAQSVVLKGAYPAVLVSDTIQLLAYPIESAIAEKLQAMVALGNANSRMKDFYDVWTCSNHLDFNADALLGAISATFKNRETLIPAEEFDAFTERFVEQHQVQWNAFVKKIGEEKLTDAFGKIVEEIKAFALPALRALARNEKLAEQWRAGIGWIS